MLQCAFMPALGLSTRHDGLGLTCRTETGMIGGCSIEGKSKNAKDERKDKAGHRRCFVASSLHGPIYVPLASVYHHAPQSQNVTRLRARSASGWRVQDLHNRLSFPHEHSPMESQPKSTSKPHYVIRIHHLFELLHGLDISRAV